MNRHRRAANGHGGEILPWTASHTRQHGEGSSSIDRVVPGLQHRVEPDPAEMADRYGADTSVLDWRERLVCSAIIEDELECDLDHTARPAWNVYSTGQ
jgi:hypothetical protein